jgi:ABC-type dipeptide/oligopeptide/nickel transport system permease component
MVLVVVATLTFFLSRIVPASPAAFLAGQNASADTVARIRAEYGLDQPLLIQYVDYMRHLAEGDFGISIRTGQPASQGLLRFLPATLELLVTSFIAYLAISFGLAAKRGSRYRAGMTNASTRDKGTYLIACHSRSSCGPGSHYGPRGQWGRCPAISALPKARRPRDQAVRRQ